MIASKASIAHVDRPWDASVPHALFILSYHHTRKGQQAVHSGCMLDVFVFVCVCVRVCVCVCVSAGLFRPQSLGLALAARLPAPGHTTAGERVDCWHEVESYIVLGSARFAVLLLTWAHYLCVHAAHSIACSAMGVCS